MYIRYQHVRNAALVLLPLGVIGALVLGIGSCFMCAGGDASAPSTQTSAPEGDRPDRPSKRSAPDRQDTPRSAASDDARAIEIANRRASPNSKLKDAFEGKGWKINLYEETGDDHYDRAKIDKNRDEVDDEKWTWKEGRWEKDGGAMVWVGGAWVSADKAGGANAPANANAPADAPAEVDVVAETPAASNDKPASSGDTRFADVARKMLDERASGGKAKDILDGKGAKINLYDDDNDGTWDRAKVDIDRDENDDEKWTRKDGAIERKIVASGEVKIFKNGAWIPKD